jgi:hypothetical protein
MPARSLSLPGVNKSVVDAVFTFLEQQIPWAKGLLEKIRLLIDANLPQLHTFQVSRGLQTISAANVQQFVDSLFAFAETLEAGNFWLAALTQALNSFVDATLLPKLIAYLESIGVVTP